MNNDPNDVLPTHMNKHPVYKQFLFENGQKPYNVIDPNPSIKRCVGNFGTYEYGIIGITTLVPTYLGYTGNKSVKSFPFWVGLTSGLIAGCCYAYVYSFSRLAGFMPNE